MRLKTADIFADGMILQMEKPVPEISWEGKESSMISPGSASGENAEAKIWNISLPRHIILRGNYTKSGRFPSGSWTVTTAGQEPAAG